MKKDSDKVAYLLGVGKGLTLLDLPHTLLNSVEELKTFWKYARFINREYIELF